jgi:hypothetical protein
LPALGTFAQWLQQRQIAYNELKTEIHELLGGWYTAFNDSQGMHENEKAAKTVLTAELLRRWFCDAMLQHPVGITDMQHASVVDLLRLLDYLNDYVLVLTRQQPAIQGQPATERVDLVDKGALNARLARSYLVELLRTYRLMQDSLFNCVSE